ncbi:site-specific integrase [Intestinimonas sp.]|uniref:site-specific integrase n=1 Tax=Intestinimonas sp. TaxID=1965293 RepID=UPI002620056C|nr:site-specific integrase [Intestinimonas sp.]
MQSTKRAAKKLTNPTPVQLPSGSWRCQVMVAGKRVSVVDDDPAVAHAKALALKAGLLQKETPVSSMTVGDAVDRYIESKDSVLSPSTVAGYKKIKANDLEGVVGTKLPFLTQEAVQRWVNDLAKKKSPKSVRNAHGLLSAALSVYRPDLVLRTTLPQKQKYDVKIPDLDEMSMILNAAQGSQMELPILLAMWLGLRSSEIRGLTWDCIEGDFIHIKTAIVDGENGAQEKGTKTFSGDRKIRLPQHILDVLNRTPHRSEHMVTLSGQAMYKRFSRLCKKLGVPHYRFHDLRHTAASVAMSLGVPNTYIQQRMGHKTDNMLKTTYLHTLRSKEDQFSNMIDAQYNALLHTNLHTENDGT